MVRPASGCWVAGRLTGWGPDPRAEYADVASTGRLSNRHHDQGDKHARQDGEHDQADHGDLLLPVRAAPIKTEGSATKVAMHAAPLPLLDVVFQAVGREHEQDRPQSGQAIVFGIRQVPRPSTARDGWREPIRGQQSAGTPISGETWARIPPPTFARRRPLLRPLLPASICRRMLAISRLKLCLWS